MSILGIHSPHSEQMELLNKITELEMELEQREYDVSQLTSTILTLKNDAEDSRMISQPDKELLSEVVKLRSLLREMELTNQKLKTELDEKNDYILFAEAFINGMDYE
jgi:hypothetical protein